jgi:hypothetical protein
MQNRETKGNVNDVPPLTFEQIAPPEWEHMSMSEQEAWTAKLRCAASFFGEITRDKLLRHAIIDSSDCLF